MTTPDQLAAALSELRLSSHIAGKLEAFNQALAVLRVALTLDDALVGVADLRNQAIRDLDAQRRQSMAYRSEVPQSVASHPDADLYA